MGVNKITNKIARSADNLFFGIRGIPIRQTKTPQIKIVILVPIKEIRSSVGKRVPKSAPTVERHKNIPVLFLASGKFLCKTEIRYGPNIPKKVTGMPKSIMADRKEPRITVYKRFKPKMPEKIKLKIMEEIIGIMAIKNPPIIRIFGRIVS